MNNMSNIIGNNIKIFRESLGITQSQLGKLVDKNRVQINYYENGKRIPTLFELHKFSELFGIEAYELNEQNEISEQISTAISFKKNSITSMDIKAIGNFRKIASNYIKLTKLDK